MTAVLEGIRVLDLSSYVAGPYCTKLLAEMGAEVIKVERPGVGDGARQAGPFFRDIPGLESSGLFLYLNTGKKSVTLDLKTSTGKRLLRELVDRADILVESFSPEQAQELGLDYQSLEKMKSSLIVVSISNFGSGGPYRDYKATDIVSFAMGGLMSLVGEPDRPPLKLPGPITQYWAGVHAFAGAMVALLYMDVAGESQHVDVSILDVVASHTNSAYLQYQFRGEQVGRTGNSARFLGGVSQFQPTKDDGYVLVALQPWENVTRLLGRPELMKDPRFAARDERMKHGAELEEYVSSFTKEHPKEELFQLAQEQRLTWAPINTVADLFSSPQLKDRGYFKEIDHPVTGPLPYSGPPLRYGDTRMVSQRAPLLGEHNQEVYMGLLGYAKEDVVRLRSLGII